MDNDCNETYEFVIINKQMSSFDELGSHITLFIYVYIYKEIFKIDKGKHIIHNVINLHV